MSEAASRSEYELDDASFDCPTLPPQLKKEFNFQRRRSAPPGSPAKTWYSDKYRSTDFLMDKYCVECRKEFADEHVYKRHMATFKGHKEQHEVVFNKKKQRSKTQMQRQERLQKMRETTKRHAPATARRRKIERRNAAANKFYYKLISISPAKRQTMYQELLNSVDSVKLQLKDDLNILGLKEECGLCWDYALYELCLQEGRTIFESRYFQFYDEEMESHREMYDKLDLPDRMKVNKAVRSALEAKQPSFLARYGLRFRAFRWVGNPLLVRSTSQMEEDTDDDEEDDAERVICPVKAS
ncbi:hypothetical protein BJV82DRAFT_676408 [Fennellomyces sp. T-0311]|nr:hypothetical protein BJV82DRAFT_676408 [Fennellomyces sp. T-0311]